MKMPSERNPRSSPAGSFNRIDETFSSLRKAGRKAHIPFLTGGFPSLSLSLKLSLELAKRGADVIEIGVPFSDPIADGPIIQSSSQVALAKGATLRRILNLIEQFKVQCSTPVVLMSYYNPLLRWGIRAFVKGAQAAGVDGIIVPDLPPEEAEELLGASEGLGLDLIFLVAPTSSEKRIRLISKVTRGYIYYVSVTGTTGVRRSLASDLKPAILRIREHTDLPIAVGFGISTSDQAKAASSLADGVIIGSALIAHIQKNLREPDWIWKTGEFFASFKQSPE
jgi:tryptophan synthase alpha chain